MTAPAAIVFVAAPAPGGVVTLTRIVQLVAAASPASAPPASETTFVPGRRRHGTTTVVDQVRRRRDEVQSRQRVGEGEAVQRHCACRTRQRDRHPCVGACGDGRWRNGLGHRQYGVHDEIRGDRRLRAALARLQRALRDRVRSRAGRRCRRCLHGNRDRAVSKGRDRVARTQRDRVRAWRGVQDATAGRGRSGRGGHGELRVRAQRRQRVGERRDRRRDRRRVRQRDRERADAALEDGRRARTTCCRRHSRPR